jgi:hypothetical protein
LPRLAAPSDHLVMKFKSSPLPLITCVSLLTAAGTASADEIGADVQVGGGAGAGMEGEPIATVSAPDFVQPAAIIDRKLTINQGTFAAEALLGIKHSSSTNMAGMTSSSTTEGLVLGGAYGITDKIQAGVSYGFTLNEFEIKGPLTLYGAMVLLHEMKLDVAAGANLTIDLGGRGTDAMGMPTTQVNLGFDAGLAVRYKITPKFMVFTGNPFQLDPAGQHLKLGLSGDDRKTFSVPVGVGFQATPELFAYLNTNLVTIELSDPGMSSRFDWIIDSTPLTLGAFYAVNPHIDAVLNLGFNDAQHIGDTFLIAVGARYYQ